MGLANTVIDNPDEYSSLVKQHPLVFVLFVSEHCEACLGANKRFENIAANHTDSVKSMVLDTRQTPKIEALGDIGTPTLVVYQNGKEAGRFLGIGFPEDQEQYLAGIFAHFVNGTPLPELPAYLLL